MGKKLMMIGCMLALVSAPAWAETRKDASRAFVFVRQCIERIEGVGDRSVQIITHQALRSVRLIDHLQVSGMTAEAATVAERSTALILDVEKNADALVDRVWENCALLLANFEAPQQAHDQLDRAATATKSAIQSASDRAVMEIQEALNT